MQRAPALCGVEEGCQWQALPSPVQCEETTTQTWDLPVTGGKTLPFAPGPPFFLDLLSIKLFFGSFYTFFWGFVVSSSFYLKHHWILVIIINCIPNSCILKGSLLYKSSQQKRLPLRYKSYVYNYNLNFMILLIKKERENHKSPRKCTKCSKKIIYKEVQGTKKLYGYPI